MPPSVRKLGAVFGEIARILRVANSRGRRLERLELAARARVYPVGAAWERRDGTVATAAPRHPKMPADAWSGMRCRSLLQPHVFAQAAAEPDEAGEPEVDPMAEYRKLRNERKRERRAR